MALQGIRTIHFFLYDSVVGLSRDRAFHLDREVYIDSLHIKELLDWSTGRPGAVQVIDVKKGIAWRYSNGIVSDPRIPDVVGAYNAAVGYLLGGWLDSTRSFTGTAHLGAYPCGTFADLHGRSEYVWLDHRLPVQHRVDYAFVGYAQVTTTQRRGIELNATFPDSLFEQPR